MKSHKYRAAAGLIVTLSLIATLAVADAAVEHILYNARIFTAEPDLNAFTLGSQGFPLRFWVCGY
jgi:hypothetical protein